MEETLDRPWRGSAAEPSEATAVTQAQTSAGVPPAEQAAALQPGPDLMSFMRDAPWPLFPGPY